MKKLSHNANSGRTSQLSLGDERAARKAKRDETREKMIDDIDYIDVSSGSDDEGPRTRKRRSGGGGSAARPQPSKAVTTPLVSHFFETVFSQQMGKKNKGCGTCDPCRKPDCGSCSQCAKMQKFSGNVRDEDVVCDSRQCDNSEIIFEADEDQEIRHKKAKSHEIEFGNKFAEKDGKTYYDSVTIKGKKYDRNDHAQLVPIDPMASAQFCKILSLYQDKNKRKAAHVRWFALGQDTVLGNVADPKELFAVYDCEDVLLEDFIRKVDIQYTPISSAEEWQMAGGTRDSIITPTTHIGNQKDLYWYRHMYDPDLARFEKVPDILLEEVDPLICQSCLHLNGEFLNKSPYLTEENVLCIRGQEFKVGDGVMLLPRTLKMDLRQKKGFRKVKNPEKKDPTLYTEYWRKKNSTKGNTENMNDPFDIGIIVKISKKGVANVEVKVRVLYRPENTQFSWEDVSKCDVNMLFWTNDIQTIEPTNIEAKCFILPKNKIPDEYPFLWSQKGDFRFYFQSAYNTQLHEVEQMLPQEALEYEPTTSIKDHVVLDEPLAMMDVFAGCGGLSIGIEQSGVAKAKWAVENDFATHASDAYVRNHPDCVMINQDINDVLRQAKNGSSSKIPKKGEVDLLVGGPPCQGFSVMNVFTSGDASKFKNSLISTYLSVCDFYRPKYFILENVKNFASFKQGQVLRLCMRALVLMGYQCQFGVLQAGNFGVPQNRKRAFLMAAAPFCELPSFPLAQHSFENMPLNINMDEKSFRVKAWRQLSAPYRNITVKDAIGDLEPTAKTSKKTEYTRDPDSYFQRIVRWKNGSFINKVEHHETKKVSTIVSARIALIPKVFGSDWRDLPNCQMTLPDGTVTEILKYGYRHWKTGRPAVCSCHKRQKGVRMF